MNFNNLQDSDWQNFIFLSLLLVLMLSNILTRRNQNFGVILKYLGIWSLIGFIFVFIYSYRFELSNFKNRIIGELVPSKPQINDNGDITLTASENGHFYIDTKINDNNIRFMIDTGASSVSLSLQDAKTIGIDTNKLNFDIVYQTANGKSMGAAITIPEIEIGGIKFYDIKASVNSGNMGNSLLGMSFLKRLKRYEFYEDKLVLTP